MRTFALVPLCLAVATAFMPPPPSVRTRVVSTSLMAPHMGASRPIFQTGHGGGIIMGGGDGDDGDNTGGNGGNGGNEGGDSDKGGENPLVLFWRGYNDLLEKQPILTKALTSFVGFSLGDFLAQKFLDKAEEIDTKRLLKLATFGLLIHGPTGHFFYGFLDGKIPGTDALSVASKVGIDQLLWNPIFGCMFFSYMGLCEGKDLEGIKTTIQNDLITAVKGSWTVWPIAHAINFRFIPNSQRLLYINSVQVGYNMFLSMLAKKSAATAEPAK